MVYSTCTLLPEENLENVRHLLSVFPDLELEPFDIFGLCATEGYITLTPDEGSTSTNKSEGRYEAEVSFSFYGTGFDVMAVSSYRSPLLLVRVLAVNPDGTEGRVVKSTFVNTLYNYSYDDTTGEWKPGSNTTNLYQVPVIKIENLTYGRYKAYITATYSSLCEPLDGNEQSLFFFDSVRIYDPANNGASDDVIKDAYM